MYKLKNESYFIDFLYNKLILISNISIRFFSRSK